MNFKRVAYINSTGSESSSRRSGTGSDKKSEVTCEIESLKQIIESLKHSIENRDATLGKLAREKEKVFVELKGAQRTIRGLQQQLCDERSASCLALVRTIHTKEKEYLVEEIQRLSEKEELKFKPKHIDFNQTNVTQKEEIESMQDQLLKKDETICKLCEKYLKLKSNKSSLHRTLKRVKMEVQETHHKTIHLLEENKRIMNKLLKHICKSSSVPLDRKKYLMLLKKNIKLRNENAQLKLCLSTNPRVRVEQLRDKIVQEHTDYSPGAFTPVQQSDKSQQTHFFAEKKLTSSQKPHRRHINLHHHKLNKLSESEWTSQTLVRSLYLKHLSHFHSNESELHPILQKSSSMPCLR